MNHRSNSRSSRWDNDDYKHPVSHIKNLNNDMR